MSKYTVIIFILALYVLCVGVFATPPPDIEGQTNYGTEWTITGADYRGNQTIILDGNLTIESGGSLTLYNVTLVMNNTNYDGEYNIEVKNGGTLKILNGSNITDSPYDVDDNSASDHEFMFWVRAGANFTMINSELHECGFDFLNLGLTIEADGVEIKNSILSDNLYALRLESSNGSNIMGNNASNNEYGINLFYSNSNNVIGNNVTLNIYGGIILDNSNSNNITGNTASNNSRGIHLHYSDDNNIIGNIASNNGEYGIYLYKSNGNNVTQNNASSNIWYGFYLSQSDGNNITGNNASMNNDYGIRFYNSNLNTLEGNTISSQGYYGIHIYDSIGNNITGNEMLGVGIFISGDSLVYWNTHNIDSSNTVNGKPVYYILNQTGGSVSLGAGQVILVNCTNVTVKDQELSDTTVGILVGYSSYINITVNNFSYNWKGIYLWESHWNNITGNTAFSNFWYGIYIRRSNGNNISGNNVSNNWGGIVIDLSDRNNVTDNIVLNGTEGIHLSNSHGNNITANNASKNEKGISLFYSTGNNIIGNEAFSNSNKGIYLDHSSSNNISFNDVTFHNNHGISLWISSGNNITYNNVLENGYGILLYYSMGNNITSNTFTNNIYGIYLEWWSSGNNITANNISNNFDGLVLDDSSGNKIADNTASSNNWNGIRLYFSDGNSITNNTASSNSEHGIILEGSYCNNITGNTVSSNTDSGIYLDDSDTNNITGNYATNNDRGIFIYFSDGNSITNNTASSNIEHGIILETSYYNNITGNTASSNTDSGIYLDFSRGNNITVNNASSNLNGIFLDRSGGNNITGNYASNNERGIYIYYAGDNNITGNNASSNDEYGIWIRSSHNNYIWDNTITSNTVRGIQLDSSNRNNIKENHVSVSDYGIFLAYSLENNITHNFVYFNNWDGIHLYWSHSNNLTDNEAFFNNFCGFSLHYSDGNSVTGSLSLNNDIGIFLSDSDENNITHNNANSNDGIGIWLTSSNGNNISNNNALDNGIGIQISKTWPHPKSENNHISGNILTLNDCGILVRESILNTIINNDISFNKGNGILFDSASFNNITSNHISSNDERGIYFYSSDGNNITGNNISSNNWQGIYLWSSPNNTISNNNISLNSGYGIYLIEYSNRNNITNNTISSNNQGIHIESSNETSVNYNNISNNAEGIYLWVSIENSISSNYIFDNYNGVSFIDSDNNNVSSNNISSNSGVGIYLYSSVGNNISGNNASFNDLDGIQLRYSEYNTINNNIIFMNTMSGIRIDDDSNYNDIISNNVLNNDYGIRVIDSSDGNNITDNTFSFNSGNGIDVWSSTNNHISDNNASDNDGGIKLNLSIWNTIINNTIYSSTWHGILLSGSDRNKIINNNASLNPASGIYLGGSNENDVIGNTVSNNERGIFLFLSSDNIIENCSVFSNSYGIRPEEKSYNNIVINSTILNSGSYDFHLSGGSSIIAINTTFNKSKVYFNDETSHLTVKWFMHVYVESTDGLPISGAAIYVTNITDDSVNGSPFTTDDDGFARWVIATEYVQNDTNGGSPGGDNKVYSTPHNVTVTLGYITGYAEPEPVMDLSKVVIVVLDPEKPIANAGSDASVDEDELYTFDGSGSFDNKEIVNWTWDFGDESFGYDEKPEHIYTSSGSFVVVLNVTDTSGNWNTDTVNIFVNNVLPFADAGNDKIGEEGEQILFNGSNSIDTASDIGYLIYTWDFGDGTFGSGEVVNHRYDDNGAYTVTLQVTDDDGAISIDFITVTVNNTTPEITQITPQFLQEDEPYTVQVVATDVSGDTLTYSDNTTMFEINPMTGVISFTPTNADVGIHLVNITVVDDDGAESYIAIQMNVQNTNDAPIITSSPITIAIENSTYYYNLTVVDDDLDTITYVLDLKPEGMTIDSNGRITWTPMYQQASQTFMVIVNVSDGNDFDTQTFSITVMNVNDEPATTSTPVLTAIEDVLYTYDVDAVDVDIGDRLIYSLDTAPIGMSIDSSTGLITWVPTNDQIGVNYVAVNVTDSMGAFVTQEFTLAVANSNDAPILDAIGPLVAMEGETFSYIVTAIDIDAGDTLIFSDDTDLFDINSITGNITFKPSNDDVGMYIVRITVTDSNVTFDFENVIVTINNVNSPPSLTTIESQTLTEDVPFTLIVTATDIDIGDTQIFLDDTTLFDINPYTGEISFTPTNEEVGIYLVNITVKDRSGSIAYQAVTFTVNNVNDPSMIESIGGLTAVVGKAFSYTVMATDIDHGDTLTFSDDTEIFDIDPNTGEISFTPSEKDAGVHYVTITVTDEEGGTVQTAVTFNVLEAKGEEPYNYTWILLTIIIGIIAFFIGYLMRRKEEMELPREGEKELEEPEEIEMELLEEEPEEEEKVEGLEKMPLSLPPEEEETVEFELMEEEGIDSEESEVESDVSERPIEKIKFTQKEKMKD